MTIYFSNPRKRNSMEERYFGNGSRGSDVVVKAQLSSMEESALAAARRGWRKCVSLKDLMAMNNLTASLMRDAKEKSRRMLRGAYLHSCKGKSKRKGHYAGAAPMKKMQRDLNRILNHSRRTYHEH